MGYKEKLTELLALPKELTLNLPFVTLTGRCELCIENHKGLVEYADDKIRINTKSGILVAEGKRLLLKQVTTENLLLSGDIEKVYYVS